MRWPGTIQPSRFLSHTGHVMPGVRRVVVVPQPVGNAPITFTVPAGVQWWVAMGSFSMTTSAVVGTRSINVYGAIEATTLWQFVGEVSQAASTSGGYGITQDVGYKGNPGIEGGGQVYLPGSVLPSGMTVSIVIGGSQAGDQLSLLSMYIEEYYFTDAQLSEDARLRAELEHDIAVYEYEQAEQTRGGA